MNYLGIDMHTLTGIQRPLGGTAPTGFPQEGDNNVYSTFSQKLLLYLRGSNNKPFRINTATWAWETVATNPFPDLHQAFAMDWCPIRQMGFVAYTNSPISDIRFAAFRA